MPTRSSTPNPAEPRRPPQGSRAEAIVEAILEAAGRVLATEGYAKLTTNRVAEIAGVSIGSLYQYFPTKQAIIAEISRRLEQRASSLFDGQVATALGNSLRAAAETFVRALAGREFGNLNVRRELLRHVPRSWTESVSVPVDAAVTDMLAHYLETRHLETPGKQGDVRAGNHRLMAFILLHAVEAVVEAAVLKRHELLDDDEFFAELAELVSRYVRRSEAPDPREQS